MRIFILKRKREISKIQSILAKNKNKKGNIIKSKKLLKRKIKRKYKQIEGYVNEVHKKSALYLCKNYDRIIIPKFETKPMISNNKRGKEYERIHKIGERTVYKEELRKIKKQIKMSGDVKYVLERQSHYKFKEYLKAKAEEYSVKLYDTGEDWTTQACTKCGQLSKEYEYRRKECPYCKYGIDRDRSGSRNTLIKGINVLTGLPTAG